MPRNVEIKARVPDVEALRQRAEALSNGPVEVLDQRDTFFSVPCGRLKLRQLAPDVCELIAYDRPDEATARLSEYHLTRSSDPKAFLEVLTAALPIRGVVAKRRLLYLVGRTRIHIDEVEGLGTFMELEVVLDDRQSIEEGHRIAERLMGDLGLADAERICGAYIDLLEAGSR
jgi:predicted adenylyl cyclase CyaB